MEPCFSTIGQIRVTNRLSTVPEASAYAVAQGLLETGFLGMAVLGPSGAVTGKVTEIDLLRALASGADLKALRARDVMAGVPPIVGLETPLEHAVALMDAHHLIRLPVVERGRFVGSVTRHDLLRAWLGEWIYHERDTYGRILG